MSRLLVLVLAVLAGAAVAAQDGGFTVRTLPGRPGIDGRAWMFVDVYTGADPLVRPAGADYELRFSDRADSDGVTRWTVTLERSGAAPLTLTSDGKSAFAYVTPDARYVFLEPLRVVDARTGERYALDRALGIKPGVKIVAVSQDGRRLFLEAGSEQMELSLPR